MKKKSDGEQLFFYKKVVKVPIYYGNFVIIFSNDIERVSETVNCKKDDIGELYAFTFHRFIYGNLESWAVCFNFWTRVPISMGVITHEITHVGNRILVAREVTPDWENDEAEAYLKGWLADQVHEFIVKCGLKI
jgi:hypothetical protein